MKYDISICMPAHRAHLWENFYKSAIASVGPYKWEMILVGPNEPPESLRKKRNFKFFKDLGHPTRCAQIATMLAEGELMMWGSDDGIWQPEAIKQCIELHRSKNKKDVIVIRYAEGRNFSGTGMPDDYWVAKHPDGSWSNHWPDHHKVEKIKDDWMIAPVGLYNLEYFRELGGWDCRFEHLNMCCHDLTFRAQNNGSKVYLSPPLIVLNCDWNPNEGDHVPVQQAYDQNDLPLFNHIYSSDGDRIKIDYFNWTSADAMWKRRFGDKQ
jgi:hypothetical protein